MLAKQCYFIWGEKQGFIENEAHENEDMAADTAFKTPPKVCQQLTLEDKITTWKEHIYTVLRAQRRGTNHRTSQDGCVINVKWFSNGKCGATGGRDSESEMFPAMKLCASRQMSKNKLLR